MIDYIAPLQFAQFQFDLLVKTPMLFEFPPGATLRSAFGSMLKQCTCLQTPPCSKRCANVACSYGQIFDTPSKPNTFLGNIKYGPRPYIFSPFNTELRYLRNGRFLRLSPSQFFRFNLTLFGDAIAKLPLFIEIFQQLESIGIGQRYQEGFGKFSLIQVSCHAFQPQKEILFFLNQQHNMTETTLFQKSITTDLIDLPTTQQATLHFRSPTRLSIKNKLVQRDIPFQFSDFFNLLLRRIDGLVLQYTDSQTTLMKEQRTQLLALAQEIAVQKTQSNLWWNEQWRWSQRQQRMIPLGGFTEKCTLTGDLTPFLPFLQIGERVQIGEDTVMGLGRFTLHI